MKIKLNRVDIKNLFNWLNVPLHGQLVKSRHEFLKPLYDVFGSIDTKRVEILENYSEKGEDGKAVIENGIYKLEKANKEQAAKEITAFLESEEEYDVDKKVLADIETILTEKMTTPLDITMGAEHSKLLEKMK